ncbi:response regulator [Gemmatimonas sp.]|uniref:response regulator n=1 Tax=Gemmatimonas sp. TaxID=1962908 RepID=UPI0033409E1B
MSILDTSEYPVPETTRATVLLVEPNELDRDMLTRRLQRRGYAVLTALDGASAVEMTAAHRPDLVLLDMSLPVMDGLEATRRMKAHPDTKQVPVLILTAHALVHDRERAFGAGCDDFDTKPVELPRLLSKMEMLLDARR